MSLAKNELYKVSSQSLMTQSHSLYPNMDANENTYFTLKVRGIPKAERFTLLRHRIFAR